MMAASIVRSFNTHEVPDETILALTTGRDKECQYLAQEIAKNAKPGRRQLQHILILAPRGFGKSFMMRLAEIETQALTKRGTQVQFALLPEEQRNVTSPSSLLKEIRRVLKNEPWNTLTSRWNDDDDTAWDRAVADLDAALDEVFAPGAGLLVAGIENFDRLLSKVFKTESAQSALRKWMTRKDNRMMVLASATGTVDLDYARPIFHAFNEVALAPWSEDDCIAYFNRLRAFDGMPRLDYAQAAKARAIANFIGGNPRLARLLGDVITTRDALSVAETLDALVDDLADYYRHRIDDLGDKARALIDALIRGGEPISQSGLAERVGTTQNRIARAFADLQRGQIVIGAPAKSSRETLYRTTDRVFVHFYRTRYGGVPRHASPLVAITDFLESFFSLEEKRTEVARYLDAGQLREGRLLADLSWAEVGYGLWGPYRYQFANANAFDVYFSAIAIAEEEALRQAFKQLADQPEKAFAAAQAHLSGTLSQGSRVLWHVLVACASIGLNLDPEAKSHLHQAVVEAALEPALICIAHREQAFFNWHIANDIVQAIAEFEQSGSQVDDIAVLRLKVCAWGDQAFALQYHQRDAEAIETAQRAAALAEAIDDQWGQAGSLHLTAWSLGQLGRHEETIETAQRAAALAEAVDDQGGQAESLCLTAWSLGQLRRHEEALETAQRATALAEAVDDKQGQAESLLLMAGSLGELGRHEQAIEKARSAVTFAEAAADPREIAWGIKHLLRSAGEVAASDCVEAFARLLEVVKTCEQSNLPNAELCLSDVFAATTRAREWPTLLELWRGQASWFEASASERSGDFDRPGQTLAAIAATSGRADSYATAVDFLHVIAPIVRKEHDAPFVSPHPEAMVRASMRYVAQQCDNSGFLDDLADLLHDTYGDQFSNETALLAAAATYHKSGRDPASLERVDPDIATAIKRVWGEA